jgi:hypothetical protein
VADEVPDGEGEAVDAVGTQAAAVIANDAMKAMERTTTSSYVQGMRNLMS